MIFEKAFSTVHDFTGLTLRIFVGISNIENTLTVLIGADSLVLHGCNFIILTDFLKDLPSV